MVLNANGDAVGKKRPQEDETTLFTHWEGRHAPQSLDRFPKSLGSVLTGM